MANTKVIVEDAAGYARVATESDTPVNGAGTALAIVAGGSGLTQPQVMARGCGA